MLLNRASHIWNNIAANRLLPQFTRCNANLIRTFKTKDKAIAEKEADELLDKLYIEVRAQRFSEIVVVQTKFNANPRYLILANAFNSRHLVSGTETINKQYKKEMKQVNDDFATISISPDWNVLDFHAIVVHLFSKQCREHFDIEQLWAVGEKYDSQSQRAKVAQQDLSTLQLDDEHLQACNRLVALTVRHSEGDSSRSNRNKLR